MFTKFEMIGAGVMVGLVALALFLVQTQSSLETIGQPAAVIVAESARVVTERNSELQEVAVEPLKEPKNMQIDDVKIGVGSAVKKGDTVAVHYVGRLQDGTEFDNSKTRGAPIEFTIGAGQVITGWEEGISGMQTGGERTLVIPPEKAYGERGIGPIPPNATLVFTVELVEIK